MVEKRDQLPLALNFVLLAYTFHQSHAGCTDLTRIHRHVHPAPGQSARGVAHGDGYPSLQCCWIWNFMHAGDDQPLYREVFEVYP